MRYRVRNEHGELTFESFDALKEAVRQSLVEADDEVTEEGSVAWRKASTVPKLMSVKEQKPPLMQTEARWYLIAGVVLLVGVALLYGLMQNMIGFAVVFIVALFATSFFVYSANRRRRR